MQVTHGYVVELMRRDGWVEIRCKGDHHQFRKPGGGKTITVPGTRKGYVLSPNVIKSIERATGLSLRR